MTRTAIALSKVLIVALAAGGVLVQVVLLPIQASQSAETFPDVAALRVPILAMCTLFVVCGQAVLVCIWVLLSMVRENSIFSERAYTYVNIMIGALAAAAVLPIAAFATIQLVAHAGPPTLFLLAFGAAIACGALALVLLVMRTLLAKASEQAQFMAEVV